MGSLQESDAAAAAVAKGPRVSLKDIEDAVDKVIYLQQENLLNALRAADGHGGVPPHPLAIKSLQTFTLCVMTLENGFVVIGKSAPASPKNFDAELGKKFAYEDCIRQLWPMMGFALRDRLSKQQ